MFSQEPLDDDVAETIARCAAALDDVPLLRDELHVLRRSSDLRAQFATPLFDLQLARRGDPEARSGLTEVADALLVFWRAGTGDELARTHPALPALWSGAADLLQRFEARRLDLALTACWVARRDAAALAPAIAALGPETDRRVEFARCLYHLELARLGLDESRQEFARRAGLLAEAWGDPAVAAQLIGDDVGLLELWGELVPYLDEFFESLEEQATRRAERTTDPGEPPQLPSAPPPFAGQSPFGAPPPEAVQEPAEELPEPPPLGAERDVPSFRTLVGDFDEQQGLAPEPPPWPLFPAPPEAPPPAPEEDIVVGALEEAELSPDDLADLPPQLMTPAQGVAQAGPSPEAPPPPDTVAFWTHTFGSLELLPTDELGRGARILSCETRGERKRLNGYVESLAPWLAVPEARGMAALVTLMLAGQTREKSLFGQPNPRRAEALAAALPYLEGTSPTAAGHAAVWFELDGPETQAALFRGLTLLSEYLQWCLRTGEDPVDPDAIKAYTHK